MGDVKEFPRGMSFITNVKERVKLSQQIITQKIEIDSIQSAIVTENVLAILGVCTPIVTSGMYYLTNI